MCCCAESAVRGNLLFDMLAPAARVRVIASMTRLDVPRGRQIIRQGETSAKHFYVLAEGACEAFIQRQGEARRQKVYSYEPGRCAAPRHRRLAFPISPSILVILPDITQLCDIVKCFRQQLQLQRHNCGSQRLLSSQSFKIHNYVRHTMFIAARAMMQEAPMST